MTTKIPAPRINAQREENESQDWQAQMLDASEIGAHRLAERRKSRNPMIPDNFLDFSDAGFPSDIIVKSVQIPRPGMPAEMANYQDMLNLQWQHVKWAWISKNGGADGKAVIPTAQPHRVGGDGEAVAIVGGLYLMFANRAHYEARRDWNREKQNAKLATKIAEREEHTELGPKGTTRRVTSERHDRISYEDVMALESQEE